MTALSKGQTPGPACTIAKIVSPSLKQDLANAAVEMLDQYGIINDPALRARSGVTNEPLLLGPLTPILSPQPELVRTDEGTRRPPAPGS